MFGHSPVQNWALKSNANIAKKKNSTEFVDECKKKKKNKKKRFAEFDAYCESKLTELSERLRVDQPVESSSQRQTVAHFSGVTTPGTVFVNDMDTEARPP